MAGVLREAGRTVAPLWVAGLAVLGLVAAHLVFKSPWLNLSGKTYEWAQFMVLGLVFPAALVGTEAASRWSPAARLPWRQIKSALALLFLLAGGLLILLNGSPVVLLLALAQIVLMNGLPWQPSAATPVRTIAFFAVATVAWTLVLRPIEQFATFQWSVAVGALAAALVVVCLAVGRVDRVQHIRPVRVWSLANAAAFVALGVLAFRTDALFETLGKWGALHHWGVYVGTAEQVRQGGWLYWDVPSQYGWLSILTLAAIPTTTPWQALYLVNASLMLLLNVAVFLALRSLGSGVVNWVFSLATTVATMTLVALPGSPPIIGINILPSQGPFRFVWCLVLISLLVWEYAADEGSPIHRWILPAGTAVWLLGVLWSPESAVYCSALWLPAYALILVRHGVRWSNLWRVAARLAVPALLLLLAFVSITAYYRARIGFAPDGAAIIDYLRSFGTFSFLEAFDQNLFGSAWMLVFGFLLLATAANQMALRHGLASRSLGLFAGLWGLLWVTSSYYLGRFWVDRIFRPVVITGAIIVVLLVLVSRRAKVDGWEGVVRVGVVPILVVWLALPIAEVATAGVSGIGTPQSVLFDRRSVEEMLPPINPSLRRLFDQVRVAPTDPIAYAGSDIGNLLPPWTATRDVIPERSVIPRSWLPAPFTLLAPLPDERKTQYASRFIDRARLGGWLIQRKEEGGIVPPLQFGNMSMGVGPWLFQTLRQTHVPARIVENADWQMVWFDYVGDDPQSVRPTIPDAGFGALPPVLVVDGRPLSEQVEPRTWAFFGTGWTAGDATGSGWRGSLPADLWVYSPDAQRARLRLKADATPGRATTLSVAANGEKSAAKRLKSGGTVEADLDLTAGWNRVELAPAEAKRAGDRARADGGTDTFGLATLEIDTEGSAATDGKGQSG